MYCLQNIRNNRPIEVFSFTSILDQSFTPYIYKNCSGENSKVLIITYTVYVQLYLLFMLFKIVNM